MLREKIVKACKNMGNRRMKNLRAKKRREDRIFVILFPSSFYSYRFPNISNPCFLSGVRIGFITNKRSKSVALGVF